MSLYIIQLSQPIREEGVTYFGRTSVDRASVACYTTLEGAERTVRRLRRYKASYGTFPQFEDLQMISSDESTDVYRDRITIVYSDFGRLEYECTIHGVSLLICYDTEGLLYDENPFIDLGTEAYKDTLNDLLRS